MSCLAFLSSYTRPLQATPRSHSRLSFRERARVATISMAKKPSKRAKGTSNEKQPEPSPSAADRLSSPASAQDLLREDVERIRANRKNVPKPEVEVAPIDSLKSAISAILLWDFFLVLGLLGWLGVALVPHFASKNDVLLDPWLALWQPFIQPVLGVLMLGTIVQGTISYINSKD